MPRQYSENLKNIIKFFLSRRNRNTGLLPESCLEWCNFPLSLDLDNGGVPDNWQDVTHPSVAYCEGGFSGADEWISVTPYPQTLKCHGEPYENACIFFKGQDGKFYKGAMRNPIIFKEGAKYNSDSELFFDRRENKLFCITRKRHGNDYTSRIVIQESTDGKNWTEPQICFDTDTNIICPCCIEKTSGRGGYMFTFEIDHSTPMLRTTEVHLWETNDFSSGKFVKSSVIPWTSDVNIWHGGIFRHKNRFYLLGCGSRNDFTLNGIFRDTQKYLFLGFLTEKSGFKMWKTPILKTNGVYRSSAYVDSHGRLNCYVSFHGRRLPKNIRSHYCSGNAIAHFTVNFEELIKKLKNQEAS